MSDDNGRSNAVAGMDNIAEMVTALECDYDRLKELREELDALKAVVEETTSEVKNGGFETAEEYSEARAAMDDAENNLREWGELNLEELTELESAAGECSDREEAEQRIHEDALSVEVRSGWTCLGEPLEPEEYMILLTTGGPALRIRGELRNGEPHRCLLEYQDWGTPWTEYHGENVDYDALLTYSRCFYFGE